MAEDDHSTLREYILDIVEERVKSVPRPPWIVIYAIILHMMWGAVILAQSEPLHATPLNVLYNLGGIATIDHRLVALILVGAALGGLWSISRPAHNLSALFAAIPQQMLLTMSAYGAGAAILSGHYADGVARPVAFIFVDQLPAVLTALLYTAAILDRYIRGARAGNAPKKGRQIDRSSKYG